MTIESSKRFVPRSLDLRALVAKKSHFLFGPRQTGKTSLIRHSLGGVRTFDLLDSGVFLRLSRDLGRLGQEIETGERYVVIDEVQRLPNLLNEVHRLIEERGLHFLLTGSSARKLRAGGVNLLGGRARTKALHPLTYAELGADYDLARATRRGLLPSIYFSDDPAADLDGYASLYLQQEVVAEGLTRNAPAFSRFLRVAALCNGSIVNFTKVGNDAQVARTTVYEYFSILEDTLLLHELPAWKKSKRRKPLSSSKYYFFDIGVVAALREAEFSQGTHEYGEAFETVLFHELIAHRDYTSGDPLYYWRSKSGFEVDFVMGDHTAIEAKAKSNVSGSDLKSLHAIAEEQSWKHLICVCFEPRRRRVGKVVILPWREFLEQLWAGAFVSSR